MLPSTTALLPGGSAPTILAEDTNAMHSSLRLRLRLQVGRHEPVVSPHVSNRRSSCFGSGGLRRWQLLSSGYLELSLRTEMAIAAQCSSPVGALQLSRLRQVAGCDSCCVMLEVVKMDFMS